MKTIALTFAWILFSTFVRANAPERILAIRGWKMAGEDKYPVYISKLATVYSKDGTFTNTYYSHEMRFVNY